MQYLLHHKISALSVHPENHSSFFAYRVYLEQTLYEITDLRFSDVQLLDPTMMYPIFRSENRERLEQMLAMDARNDHLRVVDSDVQVEAAAEPAYPRYLVVAYHHFENGFDAKLDYPTLEEAEKAAQGYVNGTMESDGFAYDGAAVYDQQEHRYLRIYVRWISGFAGGSAIRWMPSIALSRRLPRIAQKSAIAIGRLASG